MKNRVIPAVLTLVALPVLFCFIHPEAAADLALAGEARVAGLSRASVNAAGHDIVYLDSGGSGIPVLMLHGFGADKYNWPRMVARMAADNRVIVPDLPGFGESTRLAQANYGLGEQRDRLHAFTEALGLTRFHLLGNSMGGYIASLYAHAYPARVRSLALFNAAGVEGNRSSAFMDALARGQNLLLTDSPEDFDRLFELLFVDEPWMPGFVRRELGARHFANRTQYARIFSQSLASGVPLDQIFDSLDVPALILWGAEDQVLSVSGVEVFQRLLPKARTVIMPDTGHLPMLERPGKTAREYTYFLQTL